MLLPACDITRSIAENMNLWSGRQVCIRVRAIAIGEIYAKSLRRRAAGGEETSQDAKDQTKNIITASPTLWNRMKKAIGIKSKVKCPVTEQAPSNVVSASDNKHANVGTIINLMSVDTLKVSDLAAYLPGMISSGPIQLTLAVGLLWHVMGVSAIPGLVIMALLLPLQYRITKAFSQIFRRVMKAIDMRINTTNEVLQNIRIIKYFAWEQQFDHLIDETRRTELKALRKRYALLATANTIYNAVPVLITFFSFLIYTMVEEKPLVPSVAFTAISLFMLLRMPLDLFAEMFARVQESLVSLRRVDAFLNEEETEKYDQLGTDNCDEYGDKLIGFKGATLSWAARAGTTQLDAMAFRLLDVDVMFQIGKLNIIAGPTGSGKTSMLMGLLGEMTRIKGKVYCSGGRSREEVHVDSQTGLADTIAYVAQSAWLMNASIKDNITFAAPFDEKRYQETIRVCALERDLEIFEQSDETLVGERGVALSSGQKQRISLARAVYSNSEHILMDDCLSAIDPHTAHWIYYQCIRGPLMAGRTCILVTHNIQLCVPSADYVVVMDNGRVCAKGSPSEVIESGELGDAIHHALKPPPNSSTNASLIPSGAPSIVDQEESDNAELTQKTKQSRKMPMDPMAEKMGTGSVKWPVMMLYLSCMGSKWFFLIALTLFLLQQMASMAINFWVRAWANQYVQFDNADISLATHATANGDVQDKLATAAALFPAHGVNNLYYIIGLAILVILGPLTLLMRDGWIYFGSLTASRRLHTSLIKSAMGAPFRFFDVTPLGQILNRFSKDLEVVDQEIASASIAFLNSMLAMFITLILITFITPGFIVPAFFITVASYFLAIFYLGASRDLKRIESIQRSPIFQQFGETLTGITTIRAYGDQRRFIRDNLARVNAANRPFIYMWACNRWIAMRADLLCQSVTFFAGVFIILSLGKIDAGAAGISLSYAMTFMKSVLWFIRRYGQNEQNMNAMERIKEHLEIEQEAASIVDENRPPETWPDKGDVEFVNYTTRYRHDFNPVLRNVSLKIQPREKIGIVGRTGAGKSSLTLALFRAIEAVSGKIIVDGIDISTMGLQDLRRKITIVPQDPTLLNGTIRSNLDPFEQYTDDQVFAALHRVHLISEADMSSAESISDDSAQSTDATTTVNKNVFLDLSYPIAESGSNLSQGQRQLICLARAVLRAPKVLIMDEATASIDHNTDAKIQKTIQEMTGTVITVAHRLQTIVDYDKVLVLDKGEVVEFAHPWELINDKESQFHSMCSSSGDLDALSRMAKKKWDESH